MVKAIRARGVLWIAAAILCGCVLALWSSTRSVARSAQFLAALESESLPEPPKLPRLEIVPVTVPSETGPVRARIYRRADRAQAPGVVVAHGIHHQGIDEGRLVPFVRHLAESGLVVLTPELKDLTDYRVTPAGIQVLRDSVDYLSSSHYVSSPEVGLLGFSFAGGLSLLAAENEGASDKLRYVASIGGYHDLSRVLRFYVNNEVETPDGTSSLQAHEYGLIVFAYGHIEELVPPQDVEVMRHALRSWLQEDRGLAAQWASLRTTSEAEQLFTLLEEQKLADLRASFERVLEESEQELVELSPRGKLADVHVPVYLLHGLGDTVIPPSETRWAQAELRAGSHQAQALVTPLLQHVEVTDQTQIVDKLELVLFLSKLL